eukprot:gnl/Hemi2/3764_TR1319_c0_g1_i1.p1 gnl/Hemi2/3764_TR1319_c0_g1~~gnl/Hemi2/3764_TR1319_c0_g1_i1.p1  ORF type:complete len:886 (-),score=289.13 gnl/Hemi2/3764_TR1319_c0_g1_i1:298-2955(-)
MGNSCCGWDDDEDVAEEALKRKIVCGDVNNVENLQQNFASNEVITSKYTVLNFLPKNLYEQFRRVANFYFLIILCIELIPGVSPFMPITSILPLAFVIAVSAVKEAWEDYLRHQNDHRNNSVECRRITKANGKDNVQAVEKRSLRVGDLVMVFENEEFPADLILLTSQRTDGHCYIETANLDGEVNLKDKSVVISGATAEGPIQMCGGANMTAIHQAIGGSVLECDVPNVELYKFDGTFKFADGSLRGTCSADSLLLRGANLRKTQWVIGLVVFTGKESKIIMNMMPGRNKMSSVEYQLNRFVLSIFFFMTFMCIVCTILCIAWKVQQGKHMWYLGSIVVVTELKVLLFDFLTFVILFNMMIPISLMVSVECVKVINSQLVESDLKMWHTKLNKGCSVNTSNLLEELAQVQYVFSDKTGTLTENIMVFKRCSVSIPARTGREVPTTTVKYSVDKDQTCGAEVQLMNEDSARHSVELRDFLLGLALCNTTNRLNVATQHQEQDILIINKNNNNRSLFVRLAKDCKSVICCRVSPLQKALVVRLMKEALAKPVTLSIGDGANDVTMIQEAHIGVGIRGREGTQAASTADYAIAQFKFLRRLLLVHGRWSYLRISTLIQYSLYKNMTLMLPMFYFASFSGYSGQSFMDGMLLTFFNIIYTCTPILCYAVFEQDISDEEAMNNPHLYKHFQACGDFDAKSFLYWMLSALWHSIVVYYGTIFLCRDDVLDAGGRQVGLWAQGMIGLTLIIIIVTLKLALETGYWTLINHINTWGSLIVFFLFLPLYSVYLTYEAPDAYYSAQILAGSGAVWLGLISLPILALLPDYVCKAHQRAFDPLPWQVYHERALKKRTRAPQTIIEEDDADAEAELAAKKPSGEKKPLLATDDASS